MPYVIGNVVVREANLGRGKTGWVNSLNQPMQGTPTWVEDSTPVVTPASTTHRGPSATMIDTDAIESQKLKAERDESIAAQKTLLEQMRKEFAENEATQRAAYEAEQKKLAEENAKRAKDFEDARLKKTEDKKQSRISSAKSELSDIERMSDFREDLVADEDTAEITGSLSEEQLKEKLKKTTQKKAKTFLESLREG